MDLAELIRSTKGDRTYEQLAQQAGGSPGRQRWQQLATMPLRTFPEADTIRAIARTLGVSQQAVLLAAAESLGLDTARTTSRLEQLMPAAAGQLDEQDENAVLGVLRAFTRQRATDEKAARDKRHEMIRHMDLIEDTVRKSGHPAERVVPYVRAFLGDRPWPGSDEDLIVAVKVLLDDPHSRAEQRPDHLVSQDNLTLAAHEPAHDFELEQEQTEHEA